MSALKLYDLTPFYTCYPGGIVVITPWREAQRRGIGWNEWQRGVKRVFECLCDEGITVQRPKHRAS